VYEIIFYTLGMLFFGALAGVCFALMGLRSQLQGQIDPVSEPELRPRDAHPHRQGSIRELQAVEAG